MFCTAPPERTPTQLMAVNRAIRAMAVAWGWAATEGTSAPRKSTAVRLT